MYLHFLSFSSQWERLQCEEEEPGQIKGAKYSNCAEACNVKHILF